MMKMNYKKGLLAAVVCALVLSLGTPLISLAQADENSGNGQDNGQNRGANVWCERLTDYAAKFMARVETRRGKVTAQKTGVEDKIQGHRTEIDARLAEIRAKAETKRLEKLDALKKKVSSEAKKTAITAFQAAVQKAVADRQAAVDAAQKAYRASVDGAITARKTAIDAAAANYQVAVEAALAKAKTDCTGTSDAAMIRTTLRAGLEAAKEKLRSDRAAVERVGEKIQSLTDTRKAALKKAQDDFLAALNTAKTELKTAFAADTETASSTDSE